MIHQLRTAILAIMVFAGSSCVHPRQEERVWATTLEQDLRSALPIMSEYDLKKIESLRLRLHARLMEEGDEKFASILGSQSYEVQTEVFNIMGPLEERQFDKFPKTRHALSAAPKI